MLPATRCVLPVHLRLRAATAAPIRRAPPLTSFSARARRGGRRRDRPSWDDVSDDDDDDDDRIDDRFFGDGARGDEPEDDGEEPPPGPAERRSPAPEPAGQLRGSDVLRALQRAAAAKEAKRKKKASAAAARPWKEEKKGGHDAKVKAAEVRPIEVRPEWAARIRELELRVQQLLDKYHPH